MIKKTIIATLLSFTTASMMAIPAQKSTITYQLPDGSQIEVLLHGDETFHYTTLLDGTLVKEGEDGYLYYARPNNKGFESTGAKVGEARNEKDSVKADNQRHAISKLRKKAFKRWSTVSRPEKLKETDINDQHGLVILVEFSNKKMARTRQEYVNMLNQEGYSRDKSTGSATDYFNESSYGKYKPVFDVYGPYTVSQPYEYYGENDSSGDDKNVPELIVEACKLASADNDLTQYDYNNDGYIDGVYVFYAGEGEANGGKENTIWPHRWVVDPEYNFDGDPDVGGVKVYDYACSNEICKSYKSEIATDLEGIGTFVHEFGHVLGFRDHYSTSDSNTEIDPSNYDVMASASYLNYGRTPMAYNAYERMFMGWLTPTQLYPSGSGDEVTLRTIDEGEAILITPDGSEHNLDGKQPSPSTFYLLENRTAKGWDYYSGYAGRKGAHGDSGLLITRIAYNAGRWEQNKVNAYRDSMGIVYMCNSVQKSSAREYYPMFPGSKIQTSVSFGSYSVKNIKLDEGTGAVSFTITDLDKHDSVNAITRPELKVWTRDGMIYVDNEIGDISVYNMVGVCVYRGKDTAIHVDRGVYIVSADGRTAKVAVR